MQTPKQPEQDNSDLDRPEQAPLYDVEPFEPTLVERGDKDYYKSPSD